MKQLKLQRWEVNMTDLFKQYKEALLEKHCMVTFKKVSGDERKMRCTLRKEDIPSAVKSDPLSQTKIRELNTDVLPVWDLEAKGWRSFRIENVTEFEIV